MHPLVGHFYTKLQLFCVVARLKCWPDCRVSHLGTQLDCTVWPRFSKILSTGTSNSKKWQVRCAKMLRRKEIEYLGAQLHSNVHSWTYSIFKSIEYWVPRSSGQVIKCKITHLKCGTEAHEKQCWWRDDRWRHDLSSWGGVLKGIMWLCTSAPDPF